MDNLKSILTDLQERFKNPLISSFIFSWILFNWKIFILTLKYLSNTELNLTFDLFVHKVSELNNNYNSLLFPISSSLFYILVFPFIRIGISFLQAWFSRMKTKYEILGSKGGIVTIDKYLKLRSIFLTKINQLEEVIKSESNYIQVAEDLRIDNLQLSKSNKENYERANELIANSQQNVLNGYWILINENKTSELVYNNLIIPIDFVKIKFNGQNIEIYSRNNPKPLHQGTITLFRQYKESSEKKFIFFCKMEHDLIDLQGHGIVPDSKRKHFYNLTFDLTESLNLERLDGSINIDLKVTLIRERELEISH